MSLPYDYDELDMETLHLVGCITKVHRLPTRYNDMSWTVQTLFSVVVEMSHGVWGWTSVHKPSVTFQFTIFETY